MKKALFALCMLAFTVGASAQATGTTGTTTFSTAGTGTAMANYKNAFFTNPVAVATNNINLFPNLRAAFQVTGDTSKTLGVLLTRVYDTSDVTSGAKPLGLTWYFYRYSTYGWWTGTRWLLADNNTGLITRSYTAGVGVAADSTITITHGLGYTPKVYSAMPQANNARVVKSVSANDTTIIFKTVLPPVNADAAIPYKVLFTK